MSSTATSSLQHVCETHQVAAVALSGSGETWRIPRNCVDERVEKGQTIKYTSCLVCYRSKGNLGLQLLDGVVTLALPALLLNINLPDVVPSHILVINTAYRRSVSCL